MQRKEEDTMVEEIYLENSRFTEIAMNVKNEMDNKFQGIHSREDAMLLIDEFIEMVADGRGDIERKLARILYESDEYTGYARERGKKLICKDKTNEAAVRAAAEQYREYAALLPDIAEFDQRFLSYLYEFYKASRSSEDYIERLVRGRMKAISPELYKESDTVRVMILKQYLKVMDFHSSKRVASVVFSDHIANAINSAAGTNKEKGKFDIGDIAFVCDGVFDVLSEYASMGREEKKNFKDKMAPLFLADDIAKGNFDHQKTIREKLYQFAIIFEMTYYTGARNEEYDPETDLEKNLFFDYYADNLLNSLKNGVDSSSVEKESSGHGINFKNFAEVIYLYYIHKVGMTAKAKLKAVEKMIDSCKTKDEKIIEHQQLQHSATYTVTYTSAVNRLMSGSEEELRSFIVKNYVLGQNGVNITRISEKNLAATKLYDGMVEFLESVIYSFSESQDLTNDVLYPLVEKHCYSETYCKGCDRRKTEGFEGKYDECPHFGIDCNKNIDSYMSRLPLNKLNEVRETIRYKILTERAVPELEKIGKIRFGADALNALEGTEEEKALFAEVLTIVENKMALKNTNNLKKCLETSFDKEAPMTRTKLIILYYYIFVMSCREEGKLGGSRISSFSSFYEEFCYNFELSAGDDVMHGVNDCLYAAGYQEIDSKNLFDMVIVFLAFRNYKFDVYNEELEIK